VGSGDHGRAGEAGVMEEGIQGDGGEGGEEEEEAAEAGTEGARREVEAADVGDVSGHRARRWQALAIGASGEAREAFLGEDVGDGDGAERVAILGEDTGDVIDGEVLLAEGDDTGPEGIVGRGLLGAFGGREEEVAEGVLAEGMAEDAEAAGGIAEAAGDDVGGEAIEEEGAEGFILAMGGVAWFEEELGEVHYSYSFTDTPIATILHE